MPKSSLALTEQARHQSQELTLSHAARMRVTETGGIAAAVRAGGLKVARAASGVVLRAGAAAVADSTGGMGRIQAVVCCVLCLSLWLAGGGDAQATATAGAAGAPTASLMGASPDGTVLLQFQQAINNFAGVRKRAGFAGWVAASNPCSGWSGVTCNAAGRVTDLDMSGWGLQGRLAPDLTSLAALRTLNLTDNLFSGGLPSDWGVPSAFANLAELKISLNPQLGGVLPPEWGLNGSFPKLQVLQVSESGIGGGLPEEWGYQGSFPSLTLLDLGANQIRGDLPASWATNGSFPKLQTLNILVNNLTGTLPPEWGADADGFPALKILDVSNNMLTGALPDAWGSLGFQGLQRLLVQNNNLTGGLPLSWGMPPRFADLNLLAAFGNKLSGAFPASWGEPGAFPSLKFLGLQPGNPDVCGAIPPRINATTVYVGRNSTGILLGGCQTPFQPIKPPAVAPVVPPAPVPAVIAPAPPSQPPLSSQPPASPPELPLVGPLQPALAVPSSVSSPARQPAVLAPSPIFLPALSSTDLPLSPVHPPLPAPSPAGLQPHAVAPFSLTLQATAPPSHPSTAPGPLVLQPDTPAVLAPTPDSPSLPPTPSLPPLEPPALAPTAASIGLVAPISPDVGPIVSPGLSSSLLPGSLNATAPPASPPPTPAMLPVVPSPAVQAPAAAAPAPLLASVPQPVFYQAAYNMSGAGLLDPSSAPKMVSALRKAMPNADNITLVSVADNSNSPLTARRLLQTSNTAAPAIVIQLNSSSRELSRQLGDLGLLNVTASRPTVLPANADGSLILQPTSPPAPSPRAAAPSPAPIPVAPASSGGGGGSNTAIIVGVVVGVLVGVVVLAGLLCYCCGWWPLRRRSADKAGKEDAELGGCCAALACCACWRHRRSGRDKEVASPAKPIVAGTPSTSPAKKALFVGDSAKKSPEKAVQTAADADEEPALTEAELRQLAALKGKAVATPERLPRPERVFAAAPPRRGPHNDDSAAEGRLRQLLRDPSGSSTPSGSTTGSEPGSASPEATLTSGLISPRSDRSRRSGRAPVAGQYAAAATCLDGRRGGNTNNSRSPGPAGRGRGRSRAHMLRRAIEFELARERQLLAEQARSDGQAVSPQRSASQGSRARPYPASPTPSSPVGSPIGSPVRSPSMQSTHSRQGGASAALARLGSSGSDLPRGGSSGQLRQALLRDMREQSSSSSSLTSLASGSGGVREGPSGSGSGGSGLGRARQEAALAARALHLMEQIEAGNMPRR
ncbi:hypothetical protein WJX72_009102 [[Myrmecia] bisecta]|uniref:Leucine-rich repeat-containing N-terminal plant-type domain-containing protein n=1 Tax=[Myrmecia] bisecta TaxID=41462 RepID=A0AAW1PBN3_9CHLO